MDPSALKIAIQLFAIGDALGAPYEFFRDRNRIYTGEFTLGPRLAPRYQPIKNGVIGQYTDDTMMMLALIEGLVAAKKTGATRTELIKSYLEFAAESDFLGRNTRALLKGIKTVKGYETRAEKIFSQKVSQSNGSLMRALPIAWARSSLQGAIDLSLLDCSITNPDPVNYWCNAIYVYIIRIIESTRSRRKFPKPSAILKKLKGYVDLEVPKVIEKVFSEAREPVSIEATKSTSKGWVVWCIKFVLYTLYQMEWKCSSLPLIAEMVISPFPGYRGCDTDTILAIVFGVWGVMLHRDLPEDEWFAKKWKVVSRAKFQEGDLSKSSNFFNDRRALDKLVDQI